MKIITISRDYGAGGHSIGQAVAKRLGIEFYDRDIIRNTVKEGGFDVSLVENEEEAITRSESILRALSPQSYNEKDVLFDVQSKVLLELVKKGPCVILGRCADAVLADSGLDVLNVFIYADDVHRAIRIGELKNTSNATEIQKAMKKADHDRKAYYHYYTGRNWGDSHNYSMSLDSGLLGYDTCVDLICAAAQA